MVGSVIDEAARKCRRCCRPCLGRCGEEVGGVRLVAAEVVGLTPLTAEKLFLHVLQERGECLPYFRCSASGPSDKASLFETSQQSLGNILIAIDGGEVNVLALKAR